jgi:tetratricopeptide (TPR) repeat protein
MAAPNLRILLVENQGELRRTFVAMLKRMGAAAVNNAPCGEEALKTISQTPVDFIISEWNLPEMSGLDLLREVRKNPITSGIPFIMLSNQGQLSEDEIAESLDYDIDGHLHKPLNYKDLESQVEGILEKRADFMETSVRLARAAAFTDIGAAKEAEIASAQEAKPKSSRVWFESGQLFEALGNDTKAKKSYVQATAVDEGCAKAYERMSNILNKEGKPDEAFKLLQKAVKLSPRNRDRQMEMTRHLLDTGNEDAARISLHKALEYETDPAARSAAAAEFFMEFGRADLAEAEYAFALEADPENVHYFNRLGLAFRHQKKFREAIENYRKASAIAPDDAVIFNNMAIALAESGDFIQAIGSLRRALVLQPRFPQAEQALRNPQVKAGQVPA